MLLEIRTPIWSSMSIGVAERYLQGDGELDIDITYVNKEGNKSFPYRYYVNKASAKLYPTQTAKGTKLYIIPIKELGIQASLCEKEDVNDEFNFDFKEEEPDDAAEEVIEAVPGTLKYQNLQMVRNLRNKAKLFHKK